MVRKHDIAYEDNEVFSPWESYSDLYCGLLLVFVLLFFFAVYQYIVIAENDVAETIALQAQMKLEQEQTLSLYKADQEYLEAELQRKTEKVDQQQNALDALQIDLDKKKDEIEAQAAALSDKEKQIEAQSLTLSAKQKQIDEQAEALTTQQRQIEEQSTALTAQQAQIDEQARELDLQSGLLAEKDRLLIEREEELQYKSNAIQDQQRQIDAQSLRIEQQEAELANQALQIEQIIGVRGQLVEALREDLRKHGIQLEVDQSGAIALPSEVLFDVNSNALSHDGQKFLDVFMPVYINVLLLPEYSEYVAEIVIEGHTDSSGEYLSNLGLSQRRALAVAEYCVRGVGNSINSNHIAVLKSLMTVNGRADQDPVYNSDGSVNFDRSRRVEIKFRLKDQEMIQAMNDLLVQYN